MKADIMIPDWNKSLLIKTARILFYCIALTNLCYSQDQDPISWRFTAKRIDERTFEVHLRARIEPERHIYSQDIPPGTALPTTISFDNNPLIVLQGAIAEYGNLEKKVVDDVLLKCYGGQVEFVQRVKLNASIKTSLNGTVSFMVCTNTSCLPPAEKSFSITLDGRK